VSIWTWGWLLASSKETNLSGWYFGVYTAGTVVVFNEAQMFATISDHIDISEKRVASIFEVKVSLLL
jgi:hypothetical protein